MKKSILSILLFFCINVYAADSLHNEQTTRSLFLWMEKNLNQQSHFSTNDIKRYFANHFVIYSNNKKINATPKTYCNFLYHYKSNMVSVKYDIQDIFSGKNAVTVPFIIHIKSIQKSDDQNLRVIAIFSYDNSGKITQWREVFTKNR